MYHSNHPKSPSRSKTPKGEVNSFSNFRIPSPTFITTQSLTRIPPPAQQRKKERLPSSHSLPGRETQQNHSHQLTSHFIGSHQTQNERKSAKYLPNSSSGPFYNHATQQQQSSNCSMQSYYAGGGNSGSNKASPDTRNHSDHPPNESPKIKRAQVYLPGDHVIFAESPSVPGVPIVYRPEEERQSNPDKLNLDRRKLTVCPILEGEENLRLLNYQHNFIRKIEHVSSLNKLIFLDLYDNQIEEICGLSSLKLLRVLMLGKNKVKKIMNLEELVMLDVLDLHGNQISKIENVNHLLHLRVLNLAGNDLTVVENLVGLNSLSELNLRRNSIKNVYDIDQLPCLQRLFLSFNDIANFHSINCLGKSISLVELSVDGNPYSKNPEYKQTIMQNIANLRQLDMKRLTDEEKRFACITAKREEEKRKEVERLTSMKEKRRVAISNAERQWNQQVNVRSGDSHHCGNSEKFDISPRKGFYNGGPLKIVDSVKSLSSSHLAEIENNSLNLYGSGSLEALEKEWNEKTLSTINTINFKYINFQDIVPLVDKLFNNFPSLNNMNFDMTNISTLNELNWFNLIPHLHDLVITPSGNSVTKLSLWEAYIIYHFSNSQLRTLNGKEITPADKAHSKDIFDPISQILPSKLPSYRLKLMKSMYKNFSPEHMHSIKNPLWVEHDYSDEKNVEAEERLQFSSSYISEVLQNSLLGYRKVKLFNECWDELLSEMISSCLDEMSDLDKFCEASLEKLK